MKCEGCEHACGVCDKGEYEIASPKEDSEADVALNDLLVAYARLIDDVWKKAEAGRKMANGHNCDATAACQGIVDKIKQVMFTGDTP